LKIYFKTKKTSIKNSLDQFIELLNDIEKGHDKSPENKFSFNEDIGYVMSMPEDLG